jgi:hypothetical protein
MILNIKIYNYNEAIIASGLPLSSEPEFSLKRAKRLASMGDGHDNYLSGILITFNLTCTHTMLVQFQRYHFAQIISSSSKMHCIEHMDILNLTGIKYAMSEFDHPFILEQAKERGLNVHIIGERQNLKNRRTEILVTNYKKLPSLFD